jgi:NAD(P)-dependent dehydrogenase (short-subunit alcohol dehydrogenase family)
MTMHKPLVLVLLSVMFLGSTALLPGTARAQEQAREQTAQKAVLVTGASSGIGRKITEVLAGRGYFVYAGARKDKDLAELNGIDNVEAVRLDVTSQADIDAAVARIAAAGRGLHGVVNNAGVAVFTPMNETPEADIDFVFDVNVYGPYRINKAFAPLLVASKGRTTTIGSISGFISGARSGTYSMSKFAVEAYTDALAEEMADSGVRVSVIEPGGFKSEIREKVVLHAMGRTAGETGNLTEEQQQRLAQMRERNAQLKEPDEVAEAVAHALFAEKPKARYMVAPNQEEALETIRTALERVAQLNADQPYSYSAEELAGMLKEAMARQ